MITYMDDIVGKIFAKLKEHGLDDNTLVIFTADNGTHAKIVSKLPDMDLRGGKFTLNEAGCRVPFLARWPGKIKPAVVDSFISLVDVLPTIASIANIELKAEVDGMDLSHNFFSTEGVDREYVLMPFKGDCFIRDARFRLHKKSGKFLDVPITSNKERYSEKNVNSPEHDGHREKLKAIMDAYLAKETLYGGAEVVTDGSEKSKKKNIKK
jgi:arylsulfatase A